MLGFFCLVETLGQRASQSDDNVGVNDADQNTHLFAYVFRYQLQMSWIFTLFLEEMKPQRICQIFIIPQYTL